MCLVGGVGEVEEEGLGRLIERVAVDRDAYLLRRLPGSEDQRSAWRKANDRRKCLHFRRVLFRSHRLPTGDVQRDGKGRGDRPRVAFRDRDVVDRERRGWVVVEDRKSVV